MSPFEQLVADPMRVWALPRPDRLALVLRLAPLYQMACLAAAASAIPAPAPAPAELLTVGQVAARTGLAKRTVYDAVARGDLRAHRVGRAIRISVAALAAWLEPRALDGARSSARRQAPDGARATGDGPEARSDLSAVGRAPGPVLELGRPGRARRDGPLSAGRSPRGAPADPVDPEHDEAHW